MVGCFLEDVLACKQLLLSLCRGNVTVAGGPPNEDAPYIYYVSNSTDTGTATGPLYVTKSAVPATPSSKTTMYQLDYAEVLPSVISQWPSLLLIEKTMS